MEETLPGMQWGGGGVACPEHGAAWRLMAWGVCARHWTRMRQQPAHADGCDAQARWDLWKWPV
eukprot:1145320-Pelagomonas_calceolata.AAC.3